LKGDRTQHHGQPDEVDLQRSTHDAPRGQLSIVALRPSG
jgi:hypothetical protein